MPARKSLGMSVVLVLAASLGSTSLRAGIIGLDIADGGLGGISPNDGSFNVGFQFSVDTPMIVTGLGDFDGDTDADGMGSPSNLDAGQLVGLWDSSGDLIAMATVDDTSIQVGNNFAFTLLSTPILLNPEEVYTVGAQGDASYTFDNTLTPAPQIDFYQDEYSSVASGLTEPTTSEFGTNAAFLGGNVLLESTPEPSSLGLFAMGLSGVVLALVRLRRTRVRAMIPNSRFTA